MKSTFKMLTVTIAGSCIIASAVPIVFAKDAAPATPIAATTSTAVAVPTVQSPAEQAGATVASKTVEETTDSYTATLQIPVISGMLDKDYQEQLNKTLERKAMEEFGRMKAEAAEDAAAAKESGYTFHPHEMDIRYTLKAAGGAADAGKLSLSVQTYMYSGGAHGGALVETYNVNNGQKASLLTLEQLFGNDYKKQVDDAVRKAIAADPDRFFPDDIGGFEGISESQPFYVANGQVFIIFQEYEIAPYAAGIIELPVSLEEQAADSVRVVQQSKDNTKELAYHFTDNGVRLVPLRDVAEKLGYAVKWNKGTVELSQGATWTALTIGQDSYIYNRTAPIKLGAAPVLENGVTYVPQAFFSDILKLSVQVEEGTNALVIKK